MNFDAGYRRNDEAFRSMKKEIDAKYPRGHYVALFDGRVIADATTIDELRDALASTPTSSQGIYVARAGEVYPQYADILFS